MSNNDFYDTEAGKALGNMLAINIVLKQLDLSNCNMLVESTKAFAVGIRDNGALTALNLANNNLGKMVPPEGWSYGYQSDYSGNEFYKHTDGRKMKNGTPEGTTSGAIAIAAVIPDMRAISSVNLLKNDIGVEQAGALVIILKEHLTLKSLCGNKGDETELDMSGKMKGNEDAFMLAAEIVDNEALTKLTFGDKQVVTMTTKMTEANFSGKLRSCEAQIVAAFLPK
jgi:hypothetical protein